ncbi:MAG: polyphosphate kinase 2, partial [Paracoccus sp. (in: a-proteobacteria)]|nr:polyphosphate kinase 2 [Paracoccus sp. (in: a-proteobacteria)]
LLSLIPYTDVPHEEVSLPDRVFNADYEREILPQDLYVPQKY